MTRWLVTGARGMLGQDVMTVLRAGRETVMGLGRRELDITDESAVLRVIAGYRPHVVVNCAAWTGVDAAEIAEEAALRVNGRGAEYVAAACAEIGTRMVHVSAHYVFGGDADAPYAEDARPAPRTAYGRTKLAGERAVLGLLPGTGLVVRTAWLYGGTGPSFVHDMIARASQEQAVNVVADQYGQPTWTADVAGQIIALALAGAHGIFHLTSSGSVTWHGLATEVFTLLGADPALVRPTTSEAFPGPAPRPACGLLGHRRHAEAGLAPIGDWRLALRRALPLLASPAAR